MTDEAVQISITIRVAESERKIEEKINPEEIEESIERIAKTAGQESLEMSVVDPFNWTQKRGLKGSVPSRF